MILLESPSGHFVGRISWLPPIYNPQLLVLMILTLRIMVRTKFLLIAGTIFASTVAQAAADLIERADPHELLPRDALAPLLATLRDVEYTGEHPKAHLHSRYVPMVETPRDARKRSAKRDYTPKKKCTHHPSTGNCDYIGNGSNSTIGFLEPVGQQSVSIIFDGRTIFVPFDPVGEVTCSTVIKTTSGLGLVPLTIMSFSSVPTAASLGDKIATFLSQDDVFSEGFLTTVIVKYVGASATADTGAIEALLKSKGTKLVIFAGALTGATVQSVSGIKITEGPVLAQVYNKNSASVLTLYPAYRVYRDSYQAFLTGISPDPKGGWLPLSSGVDSDDTPSIAVPSRLYYTGSSKPLAGVRIAVKDIYDLAGLKTGCSSRAYYELYPKKTSTAPIIQLLIDAGAIPVGKSKTSQFANGENPTIDWVDYHCPFNPRGDSYNNPSSSSSGSGAAIAAYDWIDVTIGSDTGGSIRGPAGAQGVFGIRPSFGAADLTNVMPLADVLDTAGYFTRTGALLYKFGSAMYPSMKHYSQYPKKLLYPTDYWGSSPNPLFESFIVKLESFLNTTRTPISISSTWANTSGVSTPMNTYLTTTYTDIIGYYQWFFFGKPFVEDHIRAKGYFPFLNPTPVVRWGYGATLNESRYQAALTQKNTFKNWWLNTIQKSDNLTCSDSIMIYPQSSGSPSPRNTRTSSPPSLPNGFSSGRISVHAEIPDVIVPIGEAPYNSTVGSFNYAGRTEYMPVTISFLAHKNCDLMLLKLVADLEAAGIVKPVKTGSRVY
ncbi:amidase signature enzyme, partial [Cladochytrium replicatum]